MVAPSFVLANDLCLRRSARALPQWAVAAPSCAVAGSCHADKLAMHAAPGQCCGPAARPGALALGCCAQAGHHRPAGPYWHDSWHPCHTPVHAEQYGAGHARHGDWLEACRAPWVQVSGAKPWDGRMRASVAPCKVWGSGQKLSCRRLRSSGKRPRPPAGWPGVKAVRPAAGARSLHGHCMWRRPNLLI